MALRFIIGNLSHWYITIGIKYSQNKQNKHDLRYLLLRTKILTMLAMHCSIKGTTQHTSEHLFCIYMYLTHAPMHTNAQTRTHTDKTRY